MNDYDVNACMKAFSEFCDESERSELVSLEDCQYWVFERGYKAAMEEMINTITSGKTDSLSALTELPAANRASLH